MLRPSAPDVHWYARVCKGPHCIVAVLELHVHDTFFTPIPEIRMIPSSMSKASDLQSLIVVHVWFVNAMKDLEPPTIHSSVQPSSLRSVRQ